MEAFSHEFVGLHHVHDDLADGLTITLKDLVFDKKQSRVEAGMLFEDVQELSDIDSTTGMSSRFQDKSWDFFHFKSFKDLAEEDTKKSLVDVIAHRVCVFVIEE